MFVGIGWRPIAAREVDAGDKEKSMYICGNRRVYLTSDISSSSAVIVMSSSRPDNAIAEAARQKANARKAKWLAACFEAVRVKSGKSIAGSMRALRESQLLRGEKYCTGVMCARLVNVVLSGRLRRGIKARARLGVNVRGFLRPGERRMAMSPRKKCHMLCQAAEGVVAVSAMRNENLLA